MLQMVVRSVGVVIVITSEKRWLAVEGLGKRCQQQVDQRLV